MSEAARGAAPDFQRVYEEVRPKIRRYLEHLAGAREADALPQEPFIRVSRALAGFRGDSALATWVYRIATNVALDRLRSPAFKLAARAAEPEAPAVLGAAPAGELGLAPPG